MTPELRAFQYIGIFQLLGEQLVLDCDAQWHFSSCQRKALQGGSPLTYAGYHSCVRGLFRGQVGMQPHGFQP